jgi:hypothetical protein
MYGSYATQPPSQQQQQQQQYGYQQQPQQPQYGYPSPAAASLSQQQQQSSYGDGGMMTTNTPQFPPPPAAIVDAPQPQPPAPIYIDTQHDDMIHDAQLDYYGTKLATGSSGTYLSANCVCVQCLCSVFIVLFYCFVVIICLYSWCQEIYISGGGR